MARARAERDDRAVRGVEIVLVPGVLLGVATSALAQGEALATPDGVSERRTSAGDSQSARGVAPPERVEQARPPETEADLRAWFERAPREHATSAHGGVVALRSNAWIFRRADTRTLPLGGLRPGTALPLLGPAVRGAGSCTHFARVTGADTAFTCADRRGTTDLDGAWVEAARWVQPAPGVYPFLYAMSVGAPRYSRIPRPGEVKLALGARDVKLRGWAAGHDELAVDARIEPNGAVPDFLAHGASAPSPWGGTRPLALGRVPRGSTVAYTRAFEAEGETWVLTSDLTVIPARGLLPFRRSEFRGVDIDAAHPVPLAWTGSRPATRWREAEGQLVRDGAFAARSVLALAGEPRREKRRTLWRTTDGAWLDASEAGVVTDLRRAPWEAHGGKWIHVRRRSRTLVAYEGTRARFATLVGTGREHSTPLGRFTISSKIRSFTMSPDSGSPKSWTAEVPWTAWLEHPYALHATYWHESLGDEISNGCVNLSMRDAAWLFAWTAPEVPQGWASAEATLGTTFVLIED